MSDMICTGCGASVEHADYWIVGDSRLCKACDNDYGETPASDMTTTEAATAFDRLRDLLDEVGSSPRVFAIAREHLEELHAGYILEHNSRVFAEGEVVRPLAKASLQPDTPGAIVPRGVDLDLARIAGLNGVLERIAHNLELVAGAQGRRP